jgi:TolB protein
MAIYKAKYPSGTIISKLTDSGFYDAEATLSPDGNSIVFTSTRDGIDFLKLGDLELYTMDPNGTNVKRVTYTPGIFFK